MYPISSDLQGVWAATQLDTDASHAGSAKFESEVLPNLQSQLDVVGQSYKAWFACFW